MTALNSARSVLVAAEAELKDIVKDALTRGNYTEVSVIVATAKSISELRRSLGEPLDGGDEPNSSYTGNATRSPDAVTPPSNSLPSIAATRQQAHEKLDYPRFERHAKRLVKLGWSSKDRRVYEQRAPYETVEEICRRFIEKSGSRRILRIEKLLPMKTAAGDEIPSYQVYLVLKWLQQHDVVERQGKEGYLVAQADFDLKSLWDRTPTR